MDTNEGQPSQNTPPTLIFGNGDLFLSKYRIIEYIASGANGQVYKTEDLHRGVLVALKVMPLSGDQKQILRFQQEAKLVSKLNHKNIVTIFDFGVEEKLAYLSMEYIDGQPLDSIFHTNEAFDLDLFLDVFIQIVEAISHAHRRSVIHRDLKPGNILVSKKSDSNIVVKILDFGLAKCIDSDHDKILKLTASGLIVGTPIYMSPEQARSHQITPGSDIYSIGALMFVCLTGSPPLVGDSALETIMLISNTEAPAIEKAFDGQELPSELTKLVNSMLLKAVDARPHLDDEVIPTLLNLQNQIKPLTAESYEDNLATKSDTVKISLVVLLPVLLMVGASALLVYIQLQDSAPGPEPTTNETEPLDEAKRTQELLEKRKDKSKINVRGSLVVDDHFILGIKKPLLVKELNANDTNLKTLENIKVLENLEKLSVAKTAIRDSAIRNLIGMKKLEQLNLSHNKISNACLTHLSKINSLTDLNLSETHVKPGGLSELQRLYRLRSLNLTKNKLQEADFEAIAKFIPSNCVVHARTTDKTYDPLTPAAIERLQQKFPDFRFFTTNSKFMDRLKNANSKITNKNNSKHDWQNLRKEYQSLLAEATAVYDENTPKLRQLHIHLGNVEGQLSFHESEIRHFQTAARMARQLGDTQQVRALVDRLLQTTSSLPDQKKAVKIDQETRSMANSIGIGDAEIIERYGQLAQEAKKDKSTTGFVTAIRYYRKAIALQRLNNKESPVIPQLYCYVGDCYDLLGDAKEALNCYLQSIEGFEQFKPEDQTQKFARMMAYEHASRIYFENSQPAKAVEYNDKCYHHIKDVTVNKGILTKILTDRLRQLEAVKRPNHEINALKEELKSI